MQHAIAPACYITTEASSISYSKTMTLNSDKLPLNGVFTFKIAYSITMTYCPSEFTKCLVLTNIIHLTTKHLCILEQLAIKVFELGVQWDNALIHPSHKQVQYPWGSRLNISLGDFPTLPLLSLSDLFPIFTILWRSSSKYVYAQLLY